MSPPEPGSVAVNTRAALPVHLDHIREFAARVNAKLSVDDVLQNVADILRDEFEATRTVIVLGDAADRNPPIVASAGALWW